MVDIGKRLAASAVAAVGDVVFVRADDGVPGGGEGAVDRADGDVGYSGRRPAGETSSVQ